MTIPTPPEVSTLTLGPAAPATRRAIGPIAWCVLEHLAGSAEVQAGDTVSREWVRGTANALGLANDTVARALRRLAELDLVVHVPSRRGDGRFAPSHYRLAISADIFVGPPDEKADASVRSARTTNRSRPSDASQLSLLDPARSPF